ncbi:MAG: DNA primase [Clostridia bacterium]|nr:DNA primase [Clostridia bacterium]
MAIDSSFISELKLRCPIEEVIGSYVTLKRAGSRYVACCPFHNEKTPSFTVFTDTSSYYCFGCGAGGDVITFIMNRENLDYVEAVRLLAERAGLSVPENGEATEGKKQNRERMLQMHRLAARHYYNNLIAGDNACMRYLAKRGLSMSSVRRYGLGFAKDSFDDLKNLLLKNGYSLLEMESAGLLAKSRKNGSFYDKFRNRLMFPVIDLRGNVIAFSGRTLDPDGIPKYMNSPDTEIYRKGNILFGLNLAKEKNDGMLILCEGNIDVVMLAQEGFRNAVAPLGTAFTTEQARKISQYAKTAVIAFDSDNAGQKATNKAIEYLRSLGVSVRVLQMQGAKDPDEYIKTYGRERFSMLINRSKTPTEYQLDKLKETLDLTDTAQKMEYSDKSSDIIARLPSKIEREIYAGMLAKELEISVETVKSDIERRRRNIEKAEQRRTVSDEQRAIAGSTDRVNVHRRENLLAARAEETLIVILYRNPDLLHDICDKITPQDFITQFNREVFEFITDSLKNDSSAQSLSFDEKFDGAQTSKIMFLLNTAVLSDDTRSQANDCIRTIKLQGNKKIDAAKLDAKELMSLIKKETEKDEH